MDEREQRVNAAGRPRVSSFLIADILASPSSQPNGAHISPLRPRPLTFGVESILSGSTVDHDTSTAGRCAPPLWPVHPGYYWSPPHTCYAFRHAGNFPPQTAGFTDSRSTYDRVASTPSQPCTQAIPGQTKPRRPRRPWTRAVFSNLQRKGLEKRFQVQKYLTKADRHQLASMLGLSDNQVKVWFQNRRMKWRQEARESVTSTNAEHEDTK